MAKYPKGTEATMVKGKAKNCNALDLILALYSRNTQKKAAGKKQSRIYTLIALIIQQA
jgi:hypothetical protein